MGSDSRHLLQKTHRTPMGAVRFLDPISVIEPRKLCLPRTRDSAAFQHLLYLIARLGSDSRHPNVARLFFRSDFRDRTPQALLAKNLRSSVSERRLNFRAGLGSDSRPFPGSFLLQALLAKNARLRCISASALSHRAFGFRFPLPYQIIFQENSRM